MAKIIQPHPLLLIGGLGMVLAGWAPAAQAKKVALLIGIGDYLYLRDYSDTGSKLPPGDLRGPRNDVAAIKHLLVQRYGFREADIAVLLDQEATESAVRQALHRLVERTQPGDLVFVFFSGHGSRILESNWQKREERDEEDGWDETLVCADDNRGLKSYQGYRHIVDDELDRIFTALRQKADQVVFISDSCHSGTVSRDLALEGTRIKYLPPAEEEPGVGAERMVFSAARRLREAGIADAEGQATLLAACLDEEKASDSCFPGEGWHGALTHALLQVLKEAGADLTYRQVMERVRPLVAVQFSQTPQLSGPGQDSFFLGGPAVSGEVPSPPQPTTTVTITVTPPPPPLPPRPDVLYVGVQGFEGRMEEVRQALRQSPYLEPTTELAWADRLLMGSIEGGRFSGRVVLRDGTLEGQAQGDSVADLVLQLRPVLLKAYLIKQVARLASADPGLQPEVALEVVQAGKTFKVRPTAYQPLGSLVSVGDVVRFRFRAGRPCYLTLVDVGADGSVRLLFPNRYHPAQERIAPHRWYEVPSSEMSFEIVADYPTGKEMVVALATEQPLEVGQLRLKEVGEGLRAMEAPEEDGARIFTIRGKPGSESSQPVGENGLLPGTGFAVAYLIAEIVR